MVGMCGGGRRCGQIQGLHATPTPTLPHGPGTAHHAPLAPWVHFYYISSFYGEFKVSLATGINYLCNLRRGMSVEKGLVKMYLYSEPFWSAMIRDNVMVRCGGDRSVAGAGTDSRRCSLVLESS